MQSLRLACVALGLGQAFIAEAGRLRSAPDVADRVAAESHEDIEIHEGFASQEKRDIQEEQRVRADKSMSAVSTGKWVVALDRDLRTKMLVQVRVNTSQPSIKDPCATIKCAASLSCPAGFVVTSIPGHCCPYCVNPNIKLEKEIKGATGATGGTSSTFCKDVWCFPTLCLKPQTNPSTTNGQCCSVCPA
mmetsp:Transcript_43648/g.124489  ORF Transcript_43648/g.124489 Transcript_43648/m.124489 type:complete len:190 (-) Transcript_43648:124-693(-)